MRIKKKVLVILPNSRHKINHNELSVITKFPKNQVIREPPFIHILGLLSMYYIFFFMLTHAINTMSVSSISTHKNYRRFADKIIKQIKQQTTQKLRPSR